MTSDQILILAGAWVKKRVLTGNTALNKLVVQWHVVEAIEKSGAFTVQKNFASQGLGIPGRARIPELPNAVAGLLTIGGPGLLRVLKAFAKLTVFLHCRQVKDLQILALHFRFRSI
jgi:hypothetical protein